MKRREPPRLAAWALKHMRAGDYDEALDGDLHEAFLLGRSKTWYWRQMTAACALSWWSYVCVRGPALIFALLWSMLSPAWYAFVEQFETVRNFERGEQIFGPLWLPLAVILWVVLHAAFLWAGVIVFELAHVALRDPVSPKDVSRACWIVTAALPLFYGATFLLANLYWWSIPGLAHAKLAATSWGQISDLGVLPDLIRLPFFPAMAVALWGTARRFKHEG